MEPPEARARTNTLLAQLQTELKGAWKHMKNTQTKAAELRSRSNTEHATRQSQQGNKDVAEILTEINKAETRTNTFHKIKRYLFPELNSGWQMDYILVESTEPDGTKSTREVTAPTELFETLLEQNKADFSRADGTPFTVPRCRMSFQRSIGLTTPRESSTVSTNRLQRSRKRCVCPFTTCSSQTALLQQTSILPSPQKTFAER